VLLNSDCTLTLTLTKPVTRPSCLPSQANDFERYKELMAQEQDAAANEKIEVIERFLRDTEEYLTRLTEKIASVQLNQEASTAAAAATADARVQASLMGLGIAAQTVALAHRRPATLRVAAVLSCFTSPFGRDHAVPTQSSRWATLKALATRSMAMNLEQRRL